MQYIRHTCTKKVFFAYPKFKFNQVSCIFICFICQPYQMPKPCYVPCSLTCPPSAGSLSLSTKLCCLCLRYLRSTHENSFNIFLWPSLILVQAQPENVTLRLGWAFFLFPCNFPKGLPYRPPPYWLASTRQIYGLPAYWFLRQMQLNLSKDL